MISNYLPPEFDIAAVCTKHAVSRHVADQCVYMVRSMSQRRRSRERLTSLLAGVAPSVAGILVLNYRRFECTIRR